MKIPLPTLDLATNLKEFDIWITPALGEITDTDRFKEELAGTTAIFEALGPATNNFQDAQHCKPAAIAQTFAQFGVGRSRADRSNLFKSLAAALYLVTGKTDNNAKCQFPLFLRDTAQWNTLPSPRRNGTVKQVPLPRVIKSDDFMELIAAIEDKTDEGRLLEQFISFLLKDEDAVRQFWGLGYSYYALKQFGQGYEKDLLSPIVIFKVRGSVSASGGHKPEAILRGYLTSWGLTAGYDFNIGDIIVDGSIDGVKSDEKTRAYDFILPYKTTGWAAEWQQRLMVQSQFYAGDSGSVSHKNVDQATTSRLRVLNQHNDARFIEYVDGAGYFSSLNGDLKRLLSMASTRSFFQIRSAPIRLRRELQALGFITPLEIEHVIARSTGSISDVGNLLVQQGYTADETRRAVQNAVSTNVINSDGNTLSVRAERRDVVRQYLLLDMLAVHGQEIQPGAPQSAAKVLRGC